MYKGISGNEYDKHVERFDNRSTLSKLNIQFWEAKQTILQKIVKREDDCVIAYDADLDAKLQLFKSIAETSSKLLCVIEGYQDRVCILAHEESCIGRFLKECGRVNKNLVSKMLTASGKTFYYLAQQRIQLRSPLINIFQNLETFQFKAIEDTLITIEQLEKQRTAYRASLLWMKSLSSKLDPDSYPELEKFRKVQNHVRKTKMKYDKKKVDVLQKVDMLNASRCNMLSQTLTNYQTAWLTFWTNTAYTIASISNCFDGCQLNEINEIPSLEKYEIKGNKKSETSQESEREQDLLCLNEETQENRLTNELKNRQNQKEEELGKEIDLINIDDSLDLNLFSDDGLINNQTSSSKNSQEMQARKKQVDDLLTSSADSEDLILLNDILNLSSSEQSFLESSSCPNQFNFTKTDEQSKPFTFSSKKVENQQSKSKDSSKTESEKKKWKDLFNFDDLDIFNQNSKIKNNLGDC